MNEASVASAKKQKIAIIPIFLAPDRLLLTEISIIISKSFRSGTFRCSILTGDNFEHKRDQLKYFKDYIEGGRKLGHSSLFVHTLPTSADYIMATYREGECILCLLLIEAAFDTDVSIVLHGGIYATLKAVLDQRNN